MTPFRPDLLDNLAYICRKNDPIYVPGKEEVCSRDFRPAYADINLQYQSWEKKIPPGKLQHSVLFKNLFSILYQSIMLSL